MYLARTTLERHTRFSIRSTYRDGSVLRSRTVFDLGTDPSRFIVYPGGRGYYFDEAMEEELRSQGLDPTQDEMDRIFWEFLDPEIKRAINGFQRTSRKGATGGDTTGERVHIFDRRRVHYLKFAQTDQRNLARMPAKLFRHLNGKSRDEIEQCFLSEERILKRHELKRYVCTIFDLLPAFREISRRFTAQPLQSDAVRDSMDHAFIDAVCRLADDRVFWKGTHAAPVLQEYLVRYVIFYFDNEFPIRSPLEGFLNDFMNRHRRYVPPKKVRLSMEEAGRLFKTDWKTLERMDAKTLTKLYRRQALRHHPDQGGDKKKFIRLTALYKHLMQRKC